MKIFLIAGKAGSGKSEVARLIKEYYIYKKEDTIITNFSKYIKSFAMELSDWDGQEGSKPRDLLQKIGDDLREIDSDFLVDSMIKDIAFYEKMNKNVVISDVRMPNEIDKIRENYDNVMAIYVVNQFAPSKLTIEQQSHITEIALENYPDFDYTLANDNLSSLKDKVFKYLEGLE